MRWCVLNQTELSTGQVACQSALVCVSTCGNDGRIMYGIKQKLMRHAVMNSQRHSLCPFTQDAMKAALPILRAFFEFDTADEDDETIEGTLSNLSNAALGAITIHSHTIQDNNRPTSVAFGSVSSNRAESITPANLAVVLSGASGKRV